METAGKLTCRYAIQRDTGTTSTTSADSIPAWTTEKTVWGSRPAAAAPTNEQHPAERTVYDQAFQITVRYQPGIQSNRRLIWLQEATTLAAGINSSATSVSLADTLRFDGNGGDLLKLENELLSVTAGETTTTLTVSRGAKATTAASHSGGVGATRVTAFEITGVVEVGPPNTWLLLNVRRVE